MRILDYLSNRQLLMAGFCATVAILLLLCVQIMTLFVLTSRLSNLEATAEQFKADLQQQAQEVELRLSTLETTAKQFKTDLQQQVQEMEQLKKAVGALPPQLSSRSTTPIKKEDTPPTVTNPIEEPPKKDSDTSDDTPESK